jgi:hypothetical protein
MRRTRRGVSQGESAARAHAQNIERASKWQAAVAVWLLVLGFVLWFLLGAPAVLSTINAWPLLTGGGLGFAVATFVGHSLLRGVAVSPHSLRDGAWLCVLVGFVGASVALWTNQALDTSPPAAVNGVCVALKTHAKGPDTVEVQVGDVLTSLAATLAEGCGRCEDRPNVRVTMREGAFGARWVQELRCK